MGHLNIEIKAKCNNLCELRNYLRTNATRSAGEDYQIDTYFVVDRGRLKLRKSRTENYLVFYLRKEEGLKESQVWLKEIRTEEERRNLKRSMVQMVVVDKRREIYWIDNVKFHLDTIEGLGTFVEIEAQGSEGDSSRLEEQCKKYMDLFGIIEGDLIQSSYSDMVRFK